jgi:hypothetical protein
LRGVTLVGSNVEGDIFLGHFAVQRVEHSKTICWSGVLGFTWGLLINTLASFNFLLK